MGTSTGGRKAKLLTIRDSVWIPVSTRSCIIRDWQTLHHKTRPVISAHPHPLALSFFLPCAQSQLFSRLLRLLTNTSRRPPWPAGLPSVCSRKQTQKLTRSKRLVRMAAATGLVAIRAGYEERSATSGRTPPRVVPAIPA